MNRSPKLKPTLWDALVVLAVLALAGLLAARGVDFELVFVTDDGRVLYTGGLAAAFTPNEESGYTYEALA